MTAGGKGNAAGGLPEQSVRQRLYDDPRTWKALNDLLARGLDDNRIDALLDQLVELPARWHALAHETPEKKRDRRQALASRVRQLARALEQDPECGDDILVDHDTVLKGGPLEQAVHPDAPTLAEFLRDYADVVVAGDKHLDRYDDANAEKRTTHNELEHFVKREVVATLSEFLPAQTTNPVASAARLAGAILGQLVDTEEIKRIYRKR